MLFQKYPKQYVSIECRYCLGRPLTNPIVDTIHIIIKSQSKDTPTWLADYSWPRPTHIHTYPVFELFSASILLFLPMVFACIFIVGLEILKGRFVFRCQVVYTLLHGIVACGETVEVGSKGVFGCVEGEFDCVAHCVGFGGGVKENSSVKVERGVEGYKYIW